MRKFDVHTGVAAPLLQANIDTDAIIPSREMKKVSKIGLGDGLFAGWRYHYADGCRAAPREDFVLNRPEYAGTSILLAGPNFGCGSSREHAVWALVDYGVRAVIAPSFGSIFQRNCHRNGLLPVVLPAETVAALAAACEDDPQNARVTVDLRRRTVVAASGETYSFEIDAGARQRLLEGLDEIDLTLAHADEIARYKRERARQRRWAVL